LALNLARAVRNPSLDELYNFGAHAGNFAFEIGDPTLPTEVAYGADLSLRLRKSRFAGAATLFVNSVDRYIFPLQSGQVDGEGFTVVKFQSADSMFRGFEAHVDAGLTKDLWLVLGGDAVRAELRADNSPLPRIPPRRLWVGLRFEHGPFQLDGEIKNAGGADAGLRRGDAHRRLHGAELPRLVPDHHGEHGSHRNAARGQRRGRALPQSPFLHQGPRPGDGAQRQARLRRSVLSRA
jgi:outer membrane receptor protein involved in Fe transport